MQYLANEQRYGKMQYRRCGNSGLKLPAISLGLWHNFGHIDKLDNARNILHTAFDNGITHFDLANNYGPPAGSAEENFGKIYKDDFIPYRDELDYFFQGRMGYVARPIRRLGFKKISGGEP